MTDHIETNRKNWDNRTEIHQNAPEMYDIEAFKKGACTLEEYELNALGDVSGKTLLHLQCHFGMDSISWARRGAKVTAVDFSPKAIARARELSKETDTPVEFIESDVLKLDLSKTFDRVVTTYGVLCWLSDLDKWANVVAKHLKPGGIFYVIDTHPFAFTLEQNTKNNDLSVQHSYFNSGAKFWDNEYSYTGEAKLTHTENFEWAHSLEEIINALINAGLTIERLEEYPDLFFRMWPEMAPAQKKGWWKLPEGGPDIPMTFGLKASR